jgi:hypothetical protein
MAAKKIDRRAAAAAIAALACAGALAYPFFWRHFEHQPRLAGSRRRPGPALGLPGDAINAGLEGSDVDLLCAMHAAGWQPADPVTLRSSVPYRPPRRSSRAALLRGRDSRTTCAA